MKRLKRGRYGNIIIKKSIFFDFYAAATTLGEFIARVSFIANTHKNPCQARVFCFMA
ncbi:MAG: hypothetical protein ACI9DQ_000521 [Glaciecola sp.]|jgi:hypothetical protein